MNPTRFDRIAIVVGQRATRRSALGLLAALGLTGLGYGKPAAAGTCTLKANGDRCTTGTECCSGRCVRKRHSHKRFCRAALGQGICSIELDFCGPVAQDTSCGSPSCSCFLRQDGASVCADTNTHCLSEGNCTDANCRALFGNKAFCGLSPSDGCCSPQIGVCLLPCPTPDPL
jgi:hypothetical protein